VAQLVEALHWRSWLRHCARMAGRSRIRFPMVLGSTQLLTEMNTRNISWGVGLTTLPPSCVECLEIWAPQAPENLKACPGPPRPAQACTRLALPFVLWDINYWHLACHILTIMHSLLAMTAKNQGEAAVSSVGHLHDVGQGQVDTTGQNVRVISRDAYLEFGTFSTKRWSQTLKIAVSDLQ